MNILGRFKIARVTRW